jgi:hypothetical protein
MGRCSYKISRVWVPQLIVGIIGFELRTMNTSMFFLSTAAAMTVAQPSPVHYEEDGRGAVGPWGHGRTSPPQGGSLLGKGSVEIGDLIVSCGHKVLVDGYWLEDCQAQGPGPSWRGGVQPLGCGGACLPPRAWRVLFPPLSGATPP